jgi:predicted lipid-binding transport protein (Tim44 family)
MSRPRRNGRLITTWVPGMAAVLLATGTLARTGSGNHAAAPAAGSGGLSFGGGLHIGGIIAFVIILLVVRYLVRRMRGGSQSLSALGAALGAADPARPPRDLPPAIDAIRALDPGFEMESFLQRAEMTFFLVKRGIQKNDATAVRPYLNDNVFASVSQGIAQSKSQHQHVLLESLNIRGLALEDAQSSTQGQSLVIHFDLAFRAKTLDDANKVVADEGEDRRHGERWTFSRAASARTPLVGVIAAKCPACGAELRLGLDGVCLHCKASVTNGTVDWVVTEVQPAQFVGYSTDSALGTAAPTVAAGIAALTAADGAFAIETFQARVKSAFLALQDAWCKQQLDAGRAFMSPGAYFSWSAQLESMAAEGRRNVLEQLEVQRIEPIRVVHGRVFDDLTVRICAAAADFDVDQSGKVVFGDQRVRPFREDWTFQRSVGARTSNKPGTLENSCPNCGAPLSLTQIGECRYCKAAVTSGKFDWVVSRIDQEDGEESGSAVTNQLAEQLAAQVGGAVVGSVLSSLLSNRR